METTPLSVLFVFYCGSGWFPLLHVSSGGGTINGTRGAPAFWPCRHALGEPLENSSIYWQGFKESDIVLHVYRNGQEEFHHQDESFRNRTTIFPRQLPSGNFSLVVQKLTLEDDLISLKVVFMLEGKAPEKLCQATLHVAACFQEPKMKINKEGNTASCSTRGGYPEPEVQWTSEDGRTVLKRDEFSTVMKREEDGTFSVTSTANITRLDTVTCEVFNPTSRQTVRTSYEKAPSSPGVSVHIIISILIIILIIIVIFYLVRKRLRDSRLCSQNMAAQGIQPPGEASGGREASQAAAGGNQDSKFNLQSVYCDLNSEETAANHD